VTETNAARNRDRARFVDSDMSESLMDFDTRNVDHFDYQRKPTYLDENTTDHRVWIYLTLLR
jgi:hypothetical protein